MTNIGCSMVEKYPVLAVSGYRNPWSYVKDKLSSSLRNARSKIKRKLEVNPAAKVKSLRVATNEIQNRCFAFKNVLGETSRWKEN